MLVKRTGTSVEELVKEAKKLIPFSNDEKRKFYHIPCFDPVLNEINYISFILTNAHWEILTKKS